MHISAQKTVQHHIKMHTKSPPYACANPTLELTDYRPSECRDIAMKFELP